MSAETKSKHNNKKTGNLGEKIACKYLTDHGLEVIEQNYWKSWGEIDIVAHETFESVPRETKTVHFIEVKTVTHETREALDYAVTHETWRPEELVHQFKLHQLAKASETWLTEKRYLGNWQLDVIAVRMVPREKVAVVKFIKNIAV